MGERIESGEKVRMADPLGLFAAEVPFEEISPSAIHAAKRLILDCLGCVLGGSQVVPGKKLISFFSALSGERESTIIGHPQMVPSIHAGYVNGYLANLLDFDDTYFGHPGATTIPPALALAEKFHVRGKDLLASVVAGYEIGIKVADAIKPSRRRLKRVMGLSTWQIFCSVISSGKVLGLNGDQMSHAMSLAAVNSPVPSCRKLGHEDKEIHWMKNNYGWAAMGGMLAALLTREGFRGDRTFLDGPRGFWVMAGSDRYRPALMKAEISPKWAVEMVSLKPYSSCRHIHPTLDAVSALMKDGKILIDRIRHIDVTTFYEVVEYYSFFPKETLIVPFAAPYLIALTILGVPTGKRWFEEKYLSDNRVKSLANRVRFHPWPEADVLYSRVKRELISKVAIETSDGKCLAKEVRVPKGDPRNPMTDEELQRKFLSLASPILGERKSLNICRAVMNLEKLEDCAVLGRYLIGNRREKK